MRKALMLISMLLLIIAPITAKETAYGDFIFDPETGTLLKYTGKAETVNVPVELGGVKVAKIGDAVFAENTTLKKVILSNIVSEVGDYFYFECPNLDTIEVPSGNPTFASQSGVLFNKSLTTVVAFPPAKAGNPYKVPASVTSIKPYAFFECNKLTGIVLNDAFKGITGGDMFLECPSLTSVSFEASNPTYTSVNGVAFSKDKKRLLVYPMGKTETAYTVPAGVTEIGDFAFASCGKLKEVTLPSGLSKLGKCAFMDCKALTGISFPASLKGIGEWSFSNCASLAKVVFPEGFTTIGEWAFVHCKSLAGVVLPKSLTTLGEWAFSDCPKITSIVVPDKVTQIGSYTFASCTGLTSVNLPATLKTVGENAFSSCTSLVTIVIPKGVTSIGEMAFAQCTSLKSVTIPSSVTEMGWFMFEQSPGVVVYCDKDSFAEKYLIENEIKHVSK